MFGCGWNSWKYSYTLRSSTLIWLISCFAVSAMVFFKTPFKGIVEDFKGRKKCYKDDWLDSCTSGMRYNVVD